MKLLQNQSRSVLNLRKTSPNSLTLINAQENLLRLLDRLSKIILTVIQWLSNQLPKSKMSKADILMLQPTSLHSFQAEDFNLMMNLKIQLREHQ